MKNTSTLKALLTALIIVCLLVGIFSAEVAARANDKTNNGIASRTDIGISANDFNGDGIVNASDFDIWYDRYLVNNFQADLNGDSLLDVADYTIVHSEAMAYERDAGNIPGDLDGDGERNSIIDHMICWRYLGGYLGPFHDPQTPAYCFGNEWFVFFLDANSDGCLTSADSYIPNNI